MAVVLWRADGKRSGNNKAGGEFVSFLGADNEMVKGLVRMYWGALDGSMEAVKSSILAFQGHAKAAQLDKVRGSIQTLPEPFRRGTLMLDSLRWGPKTSLVLTPDAGQCNHTHHPRSISHHPSNNNKLPIELALRFVVQHCLLITALISERASHLLPPRTAHTPSKGAFRIRLGFARVQGEPCTATDITPGKDDPVPHPAGEPASRNFGEESSNLAGGLLKAALPNIERLRSSLPAVSLPELMEFVPMVQRGKGPQDYPDKKKLFSVQDFFRYTEAEGRRLFEELDRDSDGQVTLEDLETAMRKRRLPQWYARDFLYRTRKHWLAKSIGWSEFLLLMEQKEPMMLRAYNSLNLSKFGTLQKSQLLASLHSAGLPASEENVAAMMRCLNVATSDSIAYGQFRNFMLLLPPERLGDDPRMVWFEAATVVPMAPPVAEPTGSVLKSALAGGLACALSTSLMHPVDTIKTRVQASSTMSFPQLVSRLPEIGVKGLYRGSIPAILGQFSSHGLRTGIFEASKLVLTNISPGMPAIQVQSLSSFCSTILGTAVRIPCEVMKQRLQAGLFDNVGDALVGTWQKDGLKGFFRGTGATLCREVPFYVAGMGIYEEAKKATQRLLHRELAPWETIVVGAVSGGMAAVCTTPFDVMKTRTMTAAPGVSTQMSTIALTILKEEGVLGLFKGAVPRFFWIAPLGAMNFAGYELAKRAMEKKEDSLMESQDLKSP